MNKAEGVTKSGTNSRFAEINQKELALVFLALLHANNLVRGGTRTNVLLLARPRHQAKKFTLTTMPKGNYFPAFHEHPVTIGRNCCVN